MKIKISGSLALIRNGLATTAFGGLLFTGLNTQAQTSDLAPSNRMAAKPIDTNAQFIVNQAAATNGDPKALLALAGHYDQGLGVAKDPVKAADYARQEAEKDYPPAETALGSYYGRGIGVPKDLTEAIKWYRKAADQGYALAEFAMGGFYKSGKGVTQDIGQAMQWYRKGADQNDAACECELGLIYFMGYKTDTYHPADYNESFKWLKRSADQGYVGAMNNLGLSYIYGYGVKMDTAEGAKWVRIAAGKGNPNAQAVLGGMYRAGSTVIPQDLVAAYAWLTLSARGGNVEGKHSVKEVAATLTPEELKRGQEMLAYYAEHHHFKDASTDTVTH